MLDDLLGRAALKERIAALEDERDALRDRFEAERERRRDAVTDRQDAEERVNRLEDRIAELEDRVARSRGDRELDYRGTASLRGARLADVLDRLRSVDAGPEGALTAMVTDSDSLPDAVRDAFGDRAPLVARAAPCLAVADDAGLVSAALAPPAPPDPFVAWDDGFRVEDGWFRPEGAFALALVRSDVFALGEYRDGKRVDFAGFESDVKGKHSKGGFSQGRFERRRDDQIADHLERCRDAVAARDADRLFVVGERTLLGEFEDEAAATAAVDATGDPEDALDDAFRDFWTVRLRRI